MGCDSKINGKIIISYCPDCSCEVQFYHNENEVYVDEIKHALKYDENDFKEILDEKYKYGTIRSVLKGIIGRDDKVQGECP